MLLTVAIPVLNQSRDLIKTMSSIQAVDFFEDPRFEILVSDNCSSDDTSKVAQAWANSAKNVRAYSQKENLGFSGNFDFLAEKARGEYLWVVGAGDELIQRNLDALISLLELEKPDWAVVNGNYSRFSSEDNSHIVEIGNSETFNTVPVFSHAISLNIMKTAIARQRKKPKVSFRTSLVRERVTKGGKIDIWEGEIRYWPHLESIAGQFQQCSKTKLQWMFFSPKTVHLDNNDHGSWDRGFSAMKIYAQWIEVTRLASESCRNSEWLQTLSSELENWHLIRMLFLVRKDGNIPRGEILSIVRTIPQTKKSLKWLVWLVVLCPTGFARFLATARSMLVTTFVRSDKPAGHTR